MAVKRFVILAELQPWDPVANAAVTLRACSVDDPRVTALNGVQWWPAIAVSPRRTLDLFDGNFSGQIEAAIGDIEIMLAPFPNAARYAWGERPVTLWRGELGAAWGSYTQIFTGITRPPRAGNGRMRLGLRVDDRWMDRPLLATYAGTGNAEGPADLKGVPKPLAIGAPQFVEGVTINRTLNIVQIHGYGAINGVPTALDRLNRFGSSAGNDASYAVLAAASIAPGAWRTCLAEGLVRFGAPPAGIASFLAQGDSGSALGWVRTPGQVIRRIALIAGATAGQIDTASLSALDTACPFNISLHIKDQTTAREVIQQIAASCNAAAGVSHLGKLFVARAVIGTPALTLSAAGAALPPVADVQMLEVSAPFWRTALQAEPTWRVHSFGDFGQIDFADIGGVTKPADNATLGENMLTNPGLASDTRGWNTAFGGAGLSRVNGGSSDPAPGYMRILGAGVGSFLSDNYVIGDATRIYLNWSARRNSSFASSYNYMALYWFDRAGAPLTPVFSGVDPINAGAAANTWSPQSYEFVKPAGAYFCRVQWDYGSTAAAGTFDVAAFRLSPIQRGANVTEISYALGLGAGGSILQSNGVPMAAAIQPIKVNVTDGQTLTFNPAYPRTPDVVPDLSNLPALASGESYSFRVDGLAGSGGTVRFKKRTSGGTPATLNSAAGVVITAGVEYRANKADARDARDGIYNFRIQLEFANLWRSNNAGGGGGGGGNGLPEP